MAEEFEERSGWAAILAVCHRDQKGGEQANDCNGKRCDAGSLPEPSIKGLEVSVVGCCGGDREKRDHDEQDGRQLL